MNYCKNILKVSKNNWIILLYTIFFVQVMFGQEKQQKINHIVYSIQLNESQTNNESHYNALISNLKLKMNQVTFELRYNDSVSKFCIKNNLLSKEDNNVILDIADMIGTEYYGKTNNDISFAKNIKFADFSEFTVFSFINTNWSITNEKKYIDGYECIKAFATVKKDYGDGEKNSLYNIIAWFCPNIRGLFGPKTYKGLPGIILELEQNLVIFKAIEVNYSDEINFINLSKEKLMPEFKLY